MTPQELLKKIEAEESLTATEAAMLDAYLEDGEQDRLVRTVRGLANSDEPSMVWRSALNERLGTAGTRSRRPALRWAAFAAATGAAAVMAFMFFSGEVQAPGQGERLTAELMLQWHEEAEAASILPPGGTSHAGFSAEHAAYEADEIDELLYGDPLHSL